MIAPMIRSILRLSLASLGCAALGCATPHAVAIANRLPDGSAEETAGWGAPPLCTPGPSATSVSMVSLDPRGLGHTGAVVVRESSELVPWLSAGGLDLDELPAFDPRTQVLVLAHAECDAVPPFVDVEGDFATVVVTCQAYCSGETPQPTDAAWALVLPPEHATRVRVATCPAPDPPDCGGPPRP